MGFEALVELSVDPIAEELTDRSVNLHGPREMVPISTHLLYFEQVRKALVLVYRDFATNPG